MGQPRLAEEDSHQVVPTVLSSDNFIEAHNKQVYAYLLMGLGNVGSQGFVPSPTQVQMLGPTHHYVEQGGNPYPWNYGTPQHSPQQETSRSFQPAHYSHRNQGVSNKKYNTWNNKSSGRMPRHTRDDMSAGYERSSYLPTRQLSNESLSDGGGDDAKAIKRHHHEAYSMPPYPSPANYYQNYGPDYVQYQHMYHAYRGSQHGKRRSYSRGGVPFNNSTLRNGTPSIAPDRFLNRSHLLHVSKTPSTLLTGGEWDKLSEDVWNMFMANQQTEDTFRSKMMLWKHLYITIKTTYPRFGLYLVGSTMSGLGSNSSDVDMCLLVRHTELMDRVEALQHLDLVLNHLRHSDCIEQAEVIQAKVPILKFKDSQQRLEVDLNCNNAVGIRNTHLLYCYAKMDWRVRPLVLVVKLWARRQGINDAKNMTISSYSLTLMVINYLQCGASPAVLPSLHLMYPDKFDPSTVIPQIDLHEELPPHYTENKQTLGELMLGFLDHYSNHFEFSQVAACVRLASTVSIEVCRRDRSPKNDPHQWKYLCIEEPFEHTNTARSVYDHTVFERVKSVFVNSWLTLKTTRSLDSIFEIISSKKTE